MKFKQFAAQLVLVNLFLASGLAIAGGELAEIPDFKIVPPPRDSPSAVQEIVRAWQGRWNTTKIPAILVVESVDLENGTARIVYSEGAPSGIRKAQPPRMGRSTAALTCKKNVARVKFDPWGDNFTFTLKAKKKGVLHGRAVGTEAIGENVTMRPLEH
jgi:hypothetical protein